MPSSENDFLLFQESDYPEVVEPTAFWDVLIVDDEPEIHTVTKLALTGIEFSGAGLRFHNAHSSAEAINILKASSDIAVIFLDVVMETDDAGLKLAKWIREELNNQTVRIILRTGQAGNCPEQKVIREFDINDYKTKTELTRDKLVTSLITALRSYQQVCQLEYQSEAMNTILSASKAILSLKDVKVLCKNIIDYLAVILACEPKGLICKQLQDDEAITVLGGCEGFEQYAGLKLGEISHDVVNNLAHKFKNDQHVFDHDGALFIFKSAQRTAGIYIQCDHPPSALQVKFAEIFLTSVSVALENVGLFNKLRDAAYKDGLTGIANRINFIENLASHYHENDNKSVLVLLDVMGFSDINNGLGQEVGNALLIAIVHRLQKLLPDAQLLSRIGADIFGLVIAKDKFSQCCFIENLRPSFIVGEHILPIGFKMGLCHQHDFQHSGAETLKLAYIALNQAKKESKEEGVYFQSQMQKNIALRLQMIRELRQDFESQRLEVWYQPQFNLKDLSVFGCEALLRWRSRDGSYISPAIFIPLAEDAGLIIEIGQWVLEQACLQQKRLESLGFEICIAVNVSVPQFKVKGYAKQVTDTLKKYNVAPKNIELEVTESVLMDELGSVIDSLNELKSTGIEVAIDDFGTGYSSLSYLQNLPADRLKIDRAFIKDLPEKDNGDIAAMVIALGAKLGLRTIAEGVETQAQASFLQQLGCNEVQGFLYAKPMPENALLEFIKQAN
ncbi:EAL domain-containing protein [Pseudoalteromonas sp. MMG010]|uniref:bifunctional diguanylate cyclase/phosphodiesterase n=1 Tax=Pseudoalteromonas sp. MMG010 TaxID=2822685 RepID=UPI001B3A3280|nr:EAL domain-containing protein [Pseudoalteromonas sp. MMG010]MBQ4832931.1 EAL domain-containing protein [Pseudoalteromonas sp. MMG010]